MNSISNGSTEVGDGEASKLRDKDTEARTAQLGASPNQPFIHKETAQLIDSMKCEMADNETAAESFDDILDSAEQESSEPGILEVLGQDKEVSHVEVTKRSRGRPKRQRNKARRRLTLPRKATKRIYADNKDYEGAAEVNPEALCKMEIRTAKERKLVPPTIIPVPPMRRFSISLEEKLKLILELEAGEKQAEVCKRRNLPKSTVQSIWKNREKVRRCVEKIGLDRKRVRGAQHEDLESVLIEWVNELRKTNMPVNGSQLRAKAQTVAKEFGQDKFRASIGWLDKFKARHKISFKKMSKQRGRRSRAAGDRKIAMDWMKKIWPGLCEGYSPENIFSVGETGLFFRAPPFKTAQLRAETCFNGRMSKDRLTLLLCTNSDGSEKARICAVGNIPTPKSFEGITNPSNLPVSWYFNSKAWMTKSIFEHWLTKWNANLEKSKRKVLLTLSKSPCHSVQESEYPNIRIVTLPPVVSKIAEPLERGVLVNFKRTYRRLLLGKLIRKADQNSIRNISILESLVIIHTAWCHVKPELIKYCFFRSGLIANVSGECSAVEEFQQNGSSLMDEEECEFDASLILKAKLAGIPFPDNVTLRDYSQIDWGLHVTDPASSSDTDNARFTNSTIHCVSTRNNDTEESGVPQQPVLKPHRRDVQASIETIRNWIMFCKTNCDESLHTALSFIENFTTNHEPEPVPENLSISDQQIIFHPPGTVIDSNGQISAPVFVPEPRSSETRPQLIHVPINVPRSVPGATLLTLTIDPSTTSHQYTAQGAHRLIHRIQPPNGQAGVNEIRFQLPPSSQL